MVEQSQFGYANTCGSYIRNKGTPSPLLFIVFSSFNCLSIHFLHYSLHLANFYHDFSSETLIHFIPTTSYFRLDHYYYQYYYNYQYPQYHYITTIVNVLLTIIIIIILFFTIIKVHHAQIQPSVLQACIHSSFYLQLTGSLDTSFPLLSNAYPCTPLSYKIAPYKTT